MRYITIIHATLTRIAHVLKVSLDLPTLTAALKMLIVKLSDCDFKTLHISISLSLTTILKLF